MRKLLYFIIVTLVASSIAWSRDYGITYLDEPYQSQGPADSISGIPPLPVGLKFVTDSLVNDTVGRITAHQVGFQLPPYSFQPGGLLRGRQAVVTFPPDFKLTTIDSVTYRDTDPLTPDPMISWVYVYSQSVVVRFSEEIPGPNGPYFVYITLHSVTNATAADNYRVAVKVDNTYGQTVAGPNFSDQFPLVADVPQTLELLPKEDLTLVAGTGVLFEPRLLDRYGNQVDAGPVALTIDQSQDPIGILLGNYFMARTTGVGRVMAHYGDLNAASGQITVIPGPAAALSLSLEPDTITAGQSLNHEVVVTVADLFGNRVTGYDKSIMFFSDDPLAEIVHDQDNPYRFTPADQGQKIFSGSEFIFRTAGQRTLQVADNALTAATENIFVRSAGLAGFDVSVPPVIRAGDVFSITISEARDNFGNPFYGTLAVACDQTAPDGTLPITHTIVVSAGAGVGSAMLPKAGIDTLVIAGDGFVRQVPVEVLPAEAASFGIILDSTQFVGHPFRGASSLTVNDRFGNLKTDFASTGAAVTLAVDSGRIVPDTIAAVQFIDGIATLPDYRYEGNPGSIILAAKADISGTFITGTTTFVANGITIAERQSYQIPTLVPQNWFMLLQGYGTNPGNLVPVSVEYRGGFTEGDSLALLHTSVPDCLPQSGDPNGCRFQSVLPLVAWPMPGMHDFVLLSVSMYVVDGDSIEVIHMLKRTVEITPFTPLTTIDVALPDTVLQGGIDTGGFITLGNVSTFPYTALLHVSLTIIGDTVVEDIGRGRDPFTWPNQLILPLEINIGGDLPLGHYQYLVRYSFDIRDEIVGAIGYQSVPETLAAGLDVLPRAVYEVAPQSVTPTRVTVGAQVPFAFDLLLDGITTTVLEGNNCLLTLTDGSVSSTAPLTPASITLEPGPNRITAQPTTIPYSWLGKSITGRLHLIGTEAGLASVDTELVFPFPIVVEALAGLQVLSLDLDAPNPPFVNQGQHFALTGQIINRSAVTIPGPVTVKITSDGRTIPPGNSITTILHDISPGNIVVLNVPITADTLPNPAEVFTISIEPSGTFTVLPPIDDKAAIVIQAPVTVTLRPGSVSIPNAVAYLDYGEQFEVVARFERADLSRVTGGSLVMNYSGPGDFGVVFPMERPLDTVMVWHLTAPDLDINSSFSIAWEQIPLDRNTGQPMTGLGGPIMLPFAVRASITKLVIDVQSLVTAPLQRGVTTPLFLMQVQNVTNDTRNTVRLQSVALGLTDRNGHAIDAAAIIADSGSAFYSAGVEVTTLDFAGGKANLRFSDLTISPGQEAELELRLTLRKDAAVDYFNLQLTGGDFSAEISEGPRAGESVPVYGLLDKPFSISLPQAIIAENLTESFKNYPNPFNPELEPTEIRYYLPTASDVEIMIFTATGEKVREMHFDSGSEGGRAGVNGGVFWDGRNGDGAVVLNGVYVAVIRAAEGDLSAKVKIAVVK